MDVNEAILILEAEGYEVESRESRDKRAKEDLALITVRRAGYKVSKPPRNQQDDE